MRQCATRRGVKASRTGTGPSDKIPPDSARPGNEGHMAGIEEVAKLAGVSTATVSRALSGRGHVSPASKAKVLEAAARLGYVVSSNASSLASGRTRNIGVVIPF